MRTACLGVGFGTYVVQKNFWDIPGCNTEDIPSLSPHASTLVFLDDNDIPCLFAYRRIGTMYLTLTFTRCTPFFRMATFDSILDWVPVQHSIVSSPPLPLFPSAEETSNAWKRHLLRALTKNFA